jgi:hypothetical protein
MTTLFVSHYLYVVGALQVAGGLLLLTGRWLPLGLTLLGPVIVNILAFHVLMAPAGLGMAIVVTALALFLVWRYRENFAGLVRPPQPPAAACSKSPWPTSGRSWQRSLSAVTPSSVVVLISPGMS